MAKRFDILSAIFVEIEKLEVSEHVPWRTKLKGPLLSVAPQMCPAFYVFDFQEDVLQETEIPNAVRCKLFVVCEAWLQHTLSDDVSCQLNDILLKIQNIFETREHYRLGGLAQKISEIGSKFKITSVQDRIASVEIVYEVMYIRQTNL